MKKSHVLTIMTFFSFIIIVCILVGIIPVTMKSAKKRQSFIISTPLRNPISSSRAADLRIIKDASASGSVMCTPEDPSVCQRNEEGKVLEYTVGCTGAIPSASIYICRNMRWEYIDWTNHSTCHTCKGK